MYANAQTVAYSRYKLLRSCACGREAGMKPNVEAINRRLSYLQKIQIDLLKKNAALASLRKQVQLREAAFAKTMTKGLVRVGHTSHAQLPTTG